MKQTTVSIRGITPLLMHSERLANPFDPLTREIKTYTAKRKKTEDDLLEIARLEWLGSLYFDEDVGVYIPGYNLLSSIIGGGKLRKLGTAVKRSVLVIEDKVRLDYDGSRDPDSLYADGRFVDMRSVKVGTAKVMRCRPIFPRWGCKFTLAYDEASIQADDLLRCVRDAGAMVGVGDYRPRYGRYEVL